MPLHCTIGRMAVLLVVGLMAVQVQAAPATVDDFDLGAELIDFNNLPSGVSLSEQLTTSGIKITADGAAQVIVVDESEAGVALPSPPLALLPDQPGVAIEFSFSSMKDAVGISFLLPKGESLLLITYDDQGKILEQVIATSDSDPLLPPLVSQADFIGVTLGNPVISKVRVVPVNQSQTPVIDNLLVQPSNADSVDIGPYLNDLSPGAEQEDKLAAISALLLLPSQETSQLLLDVGKLDPDSYVREKALLALAQHYDITGLSNLVDIALNDIDASVGSAARNAVFMLRQQWPIPDPPDISFTATGPFTASQPFTATITVNSPVDRDRILLRHEFRNRIVPAPGSNYGSFEGSLQAGVPLVWSVELIPEENGRDEVELVVELTLNLVDYVSYRKKLFFVIDNAGGSVSPYMFPDAPPGEEKLLPMGDPNQ